MRKPAVAALALLLVAATGSPAHFNMLLPQTASAKKGEAVTFTYQFGHPFEHQLFDAPEPGYLAVYAPDAKPGDPGTDLRKALRKVALPAGGGKTVTAYQFQFTPASRGDYVFLLETPPIWMEEDGVFLQDWVKVVLHVQSQRGWDRFADESALEFVPLTRPYGLQAGMVFQAQLLHKADTPRGWGRVGLASTLVEVERFNATSPKELPPDEQITHTAKTDPNGVVSCTVNEPGWWCLTAARDGGKKERDGKPRPVRQRATLWVHVDEKPAK
jgi:cobalt/nickel transport protein